MIKCEICNKNFNNKTSLANHIRVHKIKPKDYYDKYIKNEDEGICKNPKCNNITSFISFFKGYRDYCCSSCGFSKRNEAKRQETIKRKNREKYGVDYYFQTEEFKNKYKKKMVEKYSVDNPQRNEQIRRKTKRTNLKRYGVENPMQSEVIKEKVKNTNIKKYNVPFYTLTNEFRQKQVAIFLKKYGVDSIFKNNKIKHQIKRTNLKRYGVENPMQSEVIKEKVKEKNYKYYRNIVHNLNDYLERYNNIILIDDYNGIKKTYDFKCLNCNNIFTRYFNTRYTSNIICPYCKEGTKIENIIKNILDKHNIKYIRYDRKIISPYELDFYIPEKNIGIECNGIYWHSEQVLIKIRNQSKLTDYNKYKLCKLKEIKLLQFWENEILNNISIVESIILSKLGLLKRLCGARETTIKPIKQNQVVRNFLDDNHIQGYVKYSIAIGAYYNNKLIAIITFNRINNNKCDYILNRFCTIKYCNVPGIASKLFSYFINNYKCDSIISFSDNRISDGNLYKILGFQYVHEVKPSYYYIIDNNLYHKFNFRKNRIKNKLRFYDDDLSEYENMLNNGIDRCWDSGKIKWIFYNK